MSTFLRKDQHRFDIFAKQEKGGWRFESVVEAPDHISAKQLAMNKVGIDNPARVCIYPSR